MLLLLLTNYCFTYTVIRVVCYGMGENEHEERENKTTPTEHEIVEDNMIPFEFEICGRQRAAGPYECTRAERVACGEGQRGEAHK